MIWSKMPIMQYRDGAAEFPLPNSPADPGLAPEFRGRVFDITRLFGCGEAIFAPSGCKFLPDSRENTELPVPDHASA